MAEAKDTVMNTKQVAITKYPILATTRDVIWQGYERVEDRLILKKQADISFKAGMEKVVAWVKDNSSRRGIITIHSSSGRTTDFRVGLEQWQGFLKENGLKGKEE